MQENEFEKKLQQKLEMLQVQPTAAIWQKVKLQVAQKKKKRRFAFFFLLAFMLCAGGAVTNMLLTKVPGDTIAGNVRMKIETNEKPAADGSTASTITANNDRVYEDIPPASASENKSELLSSKEIETAGTATATDRAVELYTDTETETSSVRKPIKRKLKPKLKVTTAVPPIDEGENEIAETNSGTAEHSQAPLTEKVLETGEMQVAVAGSEVTGPVALPADIPQEKATQQPVKESEPEKTAVSKKETRKKNKERRWGIGFSLAAGVNKTASSSSSKSFSQDYTGGTSGNPNTPTAGLNEGSFSPMQPGSAFAAGIHVYRKFGRSVRLSIGLQYNYSSLSIKTGDRVDTTATLRFAVYRPGSSVNYTNRYHYVTIPVSLSAKVFSIGNRDIVMEAGASISQLAGTNALSYNSTQGRYYTGVNDLNKTVCSFSGAMAINLAGAGKPAFYIGPQVNYTVTPLAGAGLHLGLHPLFMGIRLQKDLWK